MGFMKTVAVIAEYNPFHNGHLKQFRLIKERFGEDCRVVVIMSGHFVQRGEPALLRREDRAEMCLKAGASLVLELPLAFACAGAGDFARGGVKLLKASGICRDLVCGAESTDEAALFSLAALLAEETEAFKTGLRSALDEGLSFAAARQKAALSCLPEAEREAAGRFFREPNNILALEYAIACRRENKGVKNPYERLKLHLLPREGNDLETALSDSAQASASAIRALLRREPGRAERLLALERHMPPGALAMTLTRPLADAEAHEALFYQILAARTDEELLRYRDMEEGLIGRFRKAADSWAAGAGGDIKALAATKYYAGTRFKRALLAYLLGLRKDDWEAIREDGPAFIRVAGFDKNGRYLLKLMRKLASLPMIDKNSDLLEKLSSPAASCRLQQALALRGERLYRSLNPGIPPVFDSHFKIL